MIVCVLDCLPRVCVAFAPPFPTLLSHPLSVGLLLTRSTYNPSALGIKTLKEFLFFQGSSHKTTYPPHTTHKQHRRQQQQQHTTLMADSVDERYSGTTFAIQEEDHTLANSLRFFLNTNPQVTFSGYSIPHPTEESVNIRVQTTGEVTAAQALLTACEECSKVCKHIGNAFDAAVQQYKQEQDTEMAG